MARAKKSIGGKSGYEELLYELDVLRTEQQELSKRASQLERSNLRLAELSQSKDEFIAIASHQLRTPATGVKQYIALLLEGYTEPLTPSQILFLQKANQSNDRQLQIIDDLLQVARIDSSSFRLKTERADISELVNYTLSELHEKAESRRQELIFKPPKIKVEALVDIAKFRMVIENLVENAINYSDEGKSIAIKLHRNDDFVVVSVEDQGVGIDSEDLPKLFQKFSRVPNLLSVEVGGTGLGLYWADKIVKLHGGNIEVRSKAGKGSTFIVKIPRLK